MPARITHHRQHAHVRVYMRVCSIPRVVPIIGPRGYICAHEAVLRAYEGIVANLLYLPTSSYKQPESSPNDTETSTDLLNNKRVARWYYTTRIGGCTRIRV
jgi:hypothetical protein